MTMRKLLTYATMAILLAAPLARAADTAAPAPAAAQPPAAEYKYKTPKLKRAEIDALLAKPEGLLVIDVRRPDELTKIGGLPVYLSVQAKDLESSLTNIPKDRSIVTVSNHAGRAGAAADFLASHGFKVAGAIGVENYEEEGGTLTKIAIPAPAAAAAQPPAADEYKYKTTRLKRAEIDALLPSRKTFSSLTFGGLTKSRRRAVYRFISAFRPTTSKKIWPMSPKIALS